MDTTTTAVLIGLAAYLIGSIPFGYLTARSVAGTDLRQHGSGNIGATNVARVLGAKWGVLVLLLDCLKGLLPVWLLPRLLTAPDDVVVHVRVACGVAAILGHMYPCWLGFRGGKGVATALGVVIILAHWATLVAGGVFAVSFVAFRIVSLSSMLAAVSFGVYQLVVMWPDLSLPSTWSEAAFSLAVPMLIVYRHRSNLGRLLRGEEQRFRTKSDDDPPESEQ
jgi:glycerol-3-phosphate acyltransferase PlsY